MRVTAFPQGNPTISKQVDLDDYHPLLRSLPGSVNEAFLEPYLNTPQLDISVELTEYLDLEFSLSNIAHTHLPYPNLALDNFFGKNADEEAESFIQFINRTNNYDFGDAPGDAEELAKYIFRKGTSFAFTSRTSN